MKTIEQINALLEVLDSGNAILIDELKKLKADIENLKGGVYVPKEGDMYHYVNRRGELNSMVHNGHGIDEAVIANQLIYRTHEEAERARDKRAAEVRYIRLIAEANGEEVVSFDNYSLKWLAMYLHDDNYINYTPCNVIQYKDLCYYAKSKEAAQWAVEQLTDDEIELIFKS